MGLFIIILVQLFTTHIIMTRQDLFEFVNYNSNLVIFFLVFNITIYILGYLYKKREINKYLKTDKSLLEILTNENTFKVQRNYAIIVVVLMCVNVALVTYFEQENINYISVFVDYCLWVIPSITLVVILSNMVKNKGW